VRAHVLKNVLPPFVTMIGMNMGIALGGVIFMTLAIMLLNLVVDLGYAALDPRVRLRPPALQRA
jgi:ABC-type dipeptide/oligopeptide/nickel transport system permease component